MDPSPIRAIVGGDIAIQACPMKSAARILRALSYPHPELLKAKRRGFHPPGIPDRYETAVEMPDGSVHAPRGAITQIREALAKDGYVLEFEDARAQGHRLEPMPDVEMREYQRDGVQKFVEKVQGSIVLPCAGGKTRLGAGVISTLRRSTLVLVHTNDLVDQWVKVCRDHLKIEPGIIREGIAEIRPVTIASVFSIEPYLDFFLVGGLNEAGLVIVDEAHHTPAATFQRLVMRLPARWRLGLTATPDREDGHLRLFDWSFGPRLVEFTAPDLIRMGFLTKPDVEIIETGFRFGYDGPEKGRLHALDKALIADDTRNDTIATLAAREGLAGESVLVLSNRKAHCKILGRLIAERGCPAHVLLGGGGSKGQRARVLDALRAGDTNVVIATSLADEGLDVERLSRLILAWPERARGRTIQRTGRLMRLFESKKPRLYDVVDRLVPTLASRAAARMRVYRSLGLLR